MKTNERPISPRITRIDANLQNSLSSRSAVMLGVLLSISAGAGLALAADPASPSSGGAVQISGSASLSGVQVVIPVLVPLAIAFLKLILPRVPSAWIPVLAPILGMLADLAAAKATGGTGNVVLGAVLGSAGVGLREVVDQLRKARSMEQGAGKALILVGVMGLALGLTGCKAVTQKNNIVGVTQTVIGLQLEQSPSSEFPAMRFGYVRSQFHVVPTLRETNQFLYTPRVMNKITLVKTNGNQSLVEEFETGPVK